jgi:hypothetical protein
MRTSLPRPLSDSIRHRFDMAIGGVVENQDLRHDLILDGSVRGVTAAGRDCESRTERLDAPEKISPGRASGCGRGLPHRGSDARRTGSDADILTAAA